MNPKDITGQKWNQLTAIKFLKMAGESSVWVFRCDCGQTKVCRAWSVKSGATKSCGCGRHAPRPWKRTHGKAHTPIWTRHQQMMRRCYKKGDPNYFRYGGRGIFVDTPWHDFTVYYRDMGNPPTPKHSIDRIDNNGPYSKANCRWATSKEQCSNRRSNRMITFGEETRTAKQWAERIGIPYKCFHTRLLKGWSIGRSIMQPYRFAYRTRRPLWMRTDFGES